MKSKTRIFIIIIILLLGALGIASGIVILNVSTKKIEPEEEFVPLGTNSPEGEDENFYTWDSYLIEKAFKMFNNVYNEKSFDFTKAGKYTVTLEALHKHHNQDLSEFNTDKIKCNLNNSVFTITEDKELGGLYITLNLDCTNKEPQQEN